MEKIRNIKAAAGIILFYTTITSVFSLLNKIISLLIITQCNFGSAINEFMRRYALWTFVVIAIIVVSGIYTKKEKINFLGDVLLDRTICPMIGLLVVLDGLITLSNSMPVYIMNVHAAIKYSHEVGMNTQGNVLISDAISVFIVLCEIGIGIYLVIKNRSSS